MILKYFSWIVPTLLFSLTAVAEINHDEFLGTCSLDGGGDFLIYQNLQDNTFKFNITSVDDNRIVIFEKKNVYLWYHADASFWKFRQGRHNGVFSWNFNTQVGHLKYVDLDGVYNYWHLNSCDVDERAIKH